MHQPEDHTRSHASPFPPPDETPSGWMLPKPGSNYETLVPPAPKAVAPNDATLTAPPAAPTVVLGAASAERPKVTGYEILGELGRGGMGVVYKARQTALQRLVALKMILAGGHAGEADLVRFHTEAHAVARLQHPNVVQIYEIGEQNGLPFLSLEFCAGGSLADRLDGTPLPPAQSAALAEALTQAMEAAHRQHIIHRDLKPANVLLTA